ncbi:MAG: TonB-dependent receptor [Sulfurimonas sp.]|jgi:iron complex outermembrane receptor protein
MSQPRKITLSLFLSTLLAGSCFATENLGVIGINSTTIDDKFISNPTEISNTVTMTGEQIEKINPHSVVDILSNVPGVTLENVGTDAVKVHIRGIENQMYMGEKPGVVIVIDGVPVQETSGKINIDLDNIESIKVIKGGASYLYGNDAIAGAIVITTKRPKGKNFSKIESEVGSFNSKRFSASTNQSFKNSALQLQGSYRDTDGYWDDAFVTVKSANGKYQYYINDKSDITFGADLTQRKTGDGNSVSGTLAAQTNPRSVGELAYGGYYDSDLTKFFVTYSNNIDENSNFMLNVHKYKDDKTSKLNRGTQDVSEIWDQDGAKGEYRTALGNVALMGGFDIQDNKTDQLTHLVSNGSLYSDFATDEKIYAIYTELKYAATDNLTATLNARYDRINHQYVDAINSARNISPTYDVGSYRAGFNYILTPKSSLYANISTGFRTPTVEQISRNYVSLQADPTLNIPSVIGVETTLNHEIGIRGDYAQLAYDASVYQLARKNYIGAIAGSYITSDDPTQSNYANVGDMRSRGFEMAVSSDKKKTVSFNLAYTYLDAVFTNYSLSQQLTVNTARRGQPSNATFQRVDLSGNQVPRTSKNMVNLTVNYKPSSKLTITPEVNGRSSYYADEINANKQNGFVIANLRAQYKYNDSLEFFGRIDNLFDKNYYQFVNISSSALSTMANDATIRVAPPRAFYAGLRYTF